MQARGDERVLTPALQGDEELGLPGLRLRNGAGLGLETPANRLAQLLTAAQTTGVA
ncbi:MULTISPECIES: hypothetical protein [unclassified Cryobacterium]|uniref:hypothetical protein n=1 Tax=unclassified Cryobacterium TaxID=2649013 RepID=UPI00141AAE5E|nr:MULTISPECIES: hypothetical protein [unclassified Cryobacterium]